MDLTNEYFEIVKKHYEKIWKNKAESKRWELGPIDKLNENFRVLEFPPTKKREMWTYATVGMSSLLDQEPIELHLFSYDKDESLIELLTAVAYYHQNNAYLNLHHTVNFGRSWMGKSMCNHGFISLPYLDGPDLENLSVNESVVKFYWLIPINALELTYKKEHGTDALEEKFDESGLDYLNPERESVV